jgi:hypothetical protein
MDRFRLDNFKIMDAKRQQEYDLLQKVEELRKMKEKLTHDNVCAFFAVTGIQLMLPLLNKDTL